MAKTPWLHEFVSPENVDALASECGLNERDATVLRARWGAVPRSVRALVAELGVKDWRVRQDQERVALALGRYLCGLAGQHLALGDLHNQSDAYCNLCGWLSWVKPRVDQHGTRMKTALRLTAERHFASLVRRWAAVYHVSEQEARNQLLDLLRDMP